ncbi:MAG TPA: hypothetical protein VGS19_28965 [Streptosporangiaceae bacterium]|nr:hypothetical protein [Streptosporangiaceae bacterium]
MLGSLSSWLREQRLARAWSVAEMGRQLQQAAKANADHTVPRTSILASYIRRWEGGVIAPTERYRLHYCTALGIPPARFGAPSETPVAASAAQDMTPATPAACSTLAGWGGEAGSPSALRSGGASTYAEDWRGERTPEPAPPGAQGILPLGRLVAVMAEESLDFGEWANTSNTADATLEYSTAQVGRLARDYVHAPPYPLLLDVKRLRDRVFGKLHGHQRPGLSRDLYLVASQVCGMLAWMSGDLGYQQAAQAQAWTAWVCAEHADHDGARAWVRATQSKLAYWDNRYVESAQLAEDGLTYAAPGSVPTLLASQMARALARAGRADEAGQALSRARAERERAAGEDEVGGAFGLTSAQYHYMAGTTQLWRHDPGQAISESAQAIELFQARQPTEAHYGPESLTRVDQACAHLQQGDLDGAAAALGPVLALPADLRLELLTQNLHVARQALVQPAFRDAVTARNLQEEIETYCRESITHDLRD